MSIREAFDPERAAVRWYFRESAHEALPEICIEALEHGYDGPILRRLAGLVKPTSRDIAETQIDGAFREMGVRAPVSERDCQLYLALETAQAAVAGIVNPFNAATHVRIYICRLKQEPTELSELVRLSEESEHAPRWKWGRLEKKIRLALENLARGDLQPRLTIPGLREPAT